MFKSISFNKRDKDTTKNESIKLISGTFNPMDAADVLLSVISNKIKYHEVQLLGLKNVSLEESNNLPEKRLIELKKAKQIVTQLILEARDKNCDILIDSNIEIILKPR